MIGKGKLSPFIHSDIYLSEMFFTKAEDNIYLVSSIGSKRKRVAENMNLSNICGTPEICLMLIIQAVLLIEDLQAVGVEVNEPLENFLQIT